MACSAAVVAASKCQAHAPEAVHGLFNRWVLGTEWAARETDLNTSYFFNLKAAQNFQTFGKKNLDFKMSVTDWVSCPLGGKGLSYNPVFHLSQQSCSWEGKLGFRHIGSELWFRILTLPPPSWITSLPNLSFVICKMGVMGRTYCGARMWVKYIESKSPSKTENALGTRTVSPCLCILIPCTRTLS